MMPKHSVRSTLALSLLLAGCATEMPPAPLVRTGDPVLDGRNMIDRVPPKDRVLWQYKTALSALRRGQYPEARQLLDDALLTVGGVSTDSAARKARGYFHTEDRKNFIGEPYERAMAYYYRGILYWMDGQVDNARACFRSAQIQDADVENHAYAADYVLLDYLDGFATVKLAGDGSDALQRAQKESRFGPPVPYNEKANVLFFIEFGGGPLKYASGQFHEELRIHGQRSLAQSAMISIGNERIGLMPYDDLVFQATTRGGREMDHILANKAVFKAGTDTAGNVALVSGAVLAGTPHSRHSDAGNVGLGLLAFGAVSKIISATTTPAADVRCWDNLPQYLSFSALELPPGRHTATIQFKDAQGHLLPSLARTATFDVVPGRDTVIFVSDHS